MKKNKRRPLFISLVIIAIMLLCMAFLKALVVISLQNPTETFDQSEVYGTWTAQFGQNTDQIVINEDGTFAQHYSEPPGFTFDSGKNTWFLARFPDKRMQIHLKNGRYYREGAAFFDNYGYGRQLYDPFAQENLMMDSELVLELVYQSSGQLILYPMFSSSDQSLPMWDNGKGYYIKSLPGK